ncbi:hypothetical protein GCM10025865_27210 [Paraoerskovia sediminicola]|uniref:Membrane proteinase PrsW, cleaves anti-sigma factor RsiW, M82 family n=1 Tax=Paraoerskovia sediminicola TaxID=1138587 RepID=A0ABN6XEY5_9CELL|nr:hypothetical protein GCM10025865_27210 [Paraoerskovia sediminicola]
MLSPVLVTMVALSLWGAWSLYSNQQVNFEVLGGAVALGGAAIWALWGAIAIGAIVLLQRYARRPVWTIVLALCWGGLAATYFGGLANDAMSTITQSASGADSTVWTTGPVIEETIKAVGVIGLALVPVLRRFGPADGLFYGVLVGAGFQVVEDYVYTIVSAMEAGDSPWGGMLSTVVLRGGFGALSHLVWTGLLGAGIGWVASGGRHGRGLRILGAVGLFVLAVALHAADDLFASNSQIALTLAVDVLGLVILLVLLVRVQKSERRRLAALADDHDGWGVVDRADVTEPHDRAGRRRERLALRYAYAADQFGPESRYARKAASRVGPGTPDDHDSPRRHQPSH